MCGFHKNRTTHFLTSLFHAKCLHGMIVTHQEPWIPGCNNGDTLKTDLQMGSLVPEILDLIILISLSMSQRSVYSN